MSETSQAGYMTRRELLDALAVVERERDTLRAAAERVMYEAHVTDRCVNSGAYEALRNALDAAAVSPEGEA